MRHILLVVLALLVGTSNAAETGPPPARDLDTITRKPSIREIPRARTFRFEPKGDLTPQELDQLGPYLKGKSLYPEDEQALGPAMRHLREVE
jgi:hypothetical protein